MRWLEEAKKNREEAERVWATIPSADGFHRGQVIAALTAVGATSAVMSGDVVEGDEFFTKVSTHDLRSLLRDHWYLTVRSGEEIDTTPPDVPDVPEPQLKPSSCRCDCGYTCGGPGRCDLPLQECIDKHFVVDCDHDWTGPWVEDEDGRGGSVTCAVCGMTRLAHDMVCGP